MFIPYQSYKSDYPNQVHQLNFSISQNYHLLKNCEIKYQVKKFDVNGKNYQKSGKTHLVNFLIRDHFSNCFYAELHPIDNHPSIFNFLFNAWRDKQYFEFCGIPRNIILGRHIVEKFPALYNLSKSAGVNIELADNGFATGIRSLRDWESHIRYYSIQFGNIQAFQNNSESICRDINVHDSGKTEPNLLKWINNEPKERVINDKEMFDSLFTKEVKII